MLCAPACGATRFMSPTGSDAANGLTTGTAWLTPNHAGLNCGDTISAASGTYTAFTISTVPTCARHDAVWVICATFDACKVNGSSTQGGILITASFWAIVGWEVSTPSGSSQQAACFQATPDSGPAIHDIYFIDDVANQCMGGGFVTANGGDYFVIVADIAYNAAQGSDFCFSGVSVYQPEETDTSAGTHIYVSQVFSWDNLEPATCNGGNSTDGEGIIFDTFNAAQSGGAETPYTQQSAIENTVTMFNGAYGILAGGGSGNSSSPMFVANNTAYGNFINTNQNQPLCGQIASYGFPTNNSANANRLTSYYNNLSVPGATSFTGCGSATVYAYVFGNFDSTDSVFNNAGYVSTGNNVLVNGLAPGFVVGVNQWGTNPVLANPVQPSAPSCSGKTSVIDCMSTVIANSLPTVTSQAKYGYQPVSGTPVYDPLFPQFLCGNANMPSGLVTMGCVGSSGSAIYGGHSWGARVQ